MKISDYFKPLDKRNFDMWQLKSLFTTGMGVFTDGYDLSSIGIVLLFVLSSFGITKKSPDYALWLSLLTGSALISAIAGALIFGFLANKGRKRFYGIDVTLMTVGALLQGFVTSPLELVLARTILGLGVGADYVLSPTIMAEHSNAKDRGKVIALGFGRMWGFGAIAAAVVVLGLEAAGLPSDLVWRISLAAGAIPAASVIYLRRKIPETPRYLLRVKGDIEKFEEVVKTLAKTDVEVIGEVKDVNTFSEYFAKFGKVFIAAALLWFLYDIIGYSGGLFGPSLIAKSVGIDNGAIFSLIIDFVFVIPGGILAILTIDKVGRKPLQVIGTIGMAVALLSFAALKPILPALIALILYGIHDFASSVGPGSISTAGMLGVELAPTKVRTIVQAITVAAGRTGASLTSFVFPYLFLIYGESFAFIFLSALAFIAAALTYFGIPETKAKSLEVSSGEDVVSTRESVKR